ncbi:hypothetical protein HDV62DRAFT_317769 [Trichoderma sp. SZMC 28011]
MALASYSRAYEWWTFGLKCWSDRSRCGSPWSRVLGDILLLSKRCQLVVLALLSLPGNLEQYGLLGPWNARVTALRLALRGTTNNSEPLLQWTICSGDSWVRSLWNQQTFLFRFSCWRFSRANDHNRDHGVCLRAFALVNRSGLRFRVRPADGLSSHLTILCLCSIHRWI